MTLISPAYLNDLKQMHKQGNWGADGAKWANDVRAIADGMTNVTILDYGCGQGRLRRSLKGFYDVSEYDPAISGKDAQPAPAALVVCTDVLEHVEPAHIRTVLYHLHDLTRERLFAVISLRPANKKLPNGEQAHILLQPADWWVNALEGVGFTTIRSALKPGKELIYHGGKKP